jgi:hypothetical protein
MTWRSQMCHFVLSKEVWVGFFQILESNIGFKTVIFPYCMCHLIQEKDKKTFVFSSSMDIARSWWINICPGTRYHNFKNIFAKNRRNIGVLDSKQSDVNYSSIWSQHWFLRKPPMFSPKIAENWDHNIDLRNFSASTEIRKMDTCPGCRSTRRSRTWSRCPGCTTRRCNQGSKLQRLRCKNL